MDERLRGTKTEQNLINAFAGEAQARNRYTYYSKVAREEGYEQISSIFLETAENELEHARIFYSYIIQNPLAHVDSFYPFELGKTEENLSSAIAGETEEFDVLYKEAEMIAKEEGFESISNSFHNIRIAEEHHAKRYKQLYETLCNNSVFSKDTEVTWVCRKCGYVCTSKSAPEYCPNCFHSQNHFQILCEKY